MAFTNFVKEIQLGPYSLRLLMQDETPLIEYEEQFFNHVWQLNQQFPLLSDPAYIEQFAQISNFLWKGILFQFIDSITDYQQFYIEQVERERTCPSDLFQYRLTDYKIFDVSVMHKPRLEDGQLFYFVFNTATGLPYRVTCPFPYIGDSTVVHYQILPINPKQLKF